MITQALSYIKFQWEAHNRHGIHPPFIYHLLEDIVYQKGDKKDKGKGIKPKKHYRLYQRLLKHFTPNTAFILQSDNFFSQIFEEFKKGSPEFKLYQGLHELSNHPEIDLFVFNSIENPHEILKYLKNIPPKNSSFVIIPHLRASKQQREFWELLLQDQISRVNLEFYSFGLSFFRKESSKEYFKIRF